jgi:hypothetical protein
MRLFLIIIAIFIGLLTKADSLEIKPKNNHFQIGYNHYYYFRVSQSMTSIYFKDP